MEVLFAEGVVGILFGPTAAAAAGSATLEPLPKNAAAAAAGSGCLTQVSTRGYAGNSPKGVKSVRNSRPRQA